MRILKYGIVIFTVLFLTACATAKFQAVDESKWKGHNIKEVEAKWGSANQVMQTRNGNTYYVYTTNTEQNLYHSRMTNYSGMVTPGQVNYAMPITMQRPSGMGANMQLYCTTVIEADSTGMIISAHHQGNNCINPGLVHSIANS